MLAEMLERHLDFLCANPDIVVHVGAHLTYCAGAIAERYENIGGRVIQGGKPHPPIYRRAFELAETHLGRVLEPARVLAIGDAIQTDIRGAIAQSLDSLFIASGIHQDEILGSRFDGGIEAASFTRFIQTTGFAPSAVLSRLTW
jgi:HAD superfamily hydrolase (TIGR01459 family)